MWFTLQLKRWESVSNSAWEEAARWEDGRNRERNGAFLSGTIGGKSSRSVFRGSARKPARPILGRGTVWWRTADCRDANLWRNPFIQMVNLKILLGFYDVRVFLKYMVNDNEWKWNLLKHLIEFWHWPCVGLGEQLSGIGLTINIKRQNCFMWVIRKDSGKVSKVRYPIRVYCLLIE